MYSHSPSAVFTINGGFGVTAQSRGWLKCVKLQLNQWVGHRDVLLSGTVVFVGKIRDLKWNLKR